MHNWLCNRDGFCWSRAFKISSITYSYRPHTGGQGKFKGGDGLIREIELLADAQVTLLSDRRNFRPYGLGGGEPGVAGQAVHVSGTERREIPGKCSLFVKKGDILRIETPGGGGWGDPKSK